MELQLFFALLRSVICGEALSEEYKKPISEEQLKRLLDLAKAHSLLPLLSEALLRHKLLPAGETEKLCQALLFQSISIYQQQTEALKQLCRLLNEAKIPHLPLKGSVLRKYYPEPWLRTSCDIDILVHDADIDKVSKLLTAAGYHFEERSPHDVSYRSPEGVLVEVHYRLIEKERVANADVVLENIWQFATPQKGQFGYVFCDEMFYFYHVAHMAKHIGHGGCGIRSFVDLWLLNHCLSFEQGKRKALIEQGGLTKFETVAKQLSEVWLSGAELNPLVLQFQEYTLSGGVYGNTENRVSIQQYRQGSNWKFIWKRLFLPYNDMKNRYPVLQKHKWLMPVMHMRRLSRLLSKKKWNNAIAEFKISQTVSEDSKKSIQSLWEKLEL